MHTHNLQVVEVDVEEISQHPNNVNNGDVEALEESIEVNGFYSPILVQRSTGYILAGNHRYLVAYKMGARQVPVIYLDVDDNHAKRIMLADNQITRRGFDDEGQLLDLLTELNETDQALYGTGYDDRMLDRLIDSVNTPLDFADDEEEEESPEAMEKPAKEGMFSVTPILSEDGSVYELAVQRVGMGSISRTDFQAIRRALGLSAASKSEVDAFMVPNWQRRG